MIKTCSCYLAYVVLHSELAVEVHAEISDHADWFNDVTSDAELQRFRLQLSQIHGRAEE